MIDWRGVQRRLGVPADGVPGPMTFAALLRAMGAGRLAVPLAAGMTRELGMAGILETRMRLVHWLGQNAHESAGFNRLEESLNYTSAAQIKKVWPSRFRDISKARALLRNPEMLAEAVYGRRMGNIVPGWGWHYRGRGLKMITFANNYRWMQQITGLPVFEQPDLAARPDVAVQLSARYWRHVGCSEWADRDDVRALSNLINRGSARARQSPIGLADRARRTEQARALIGV